jgi:glycosyltransferase involved in cell wall biosynthesis
MRVVHVSIIHRPLDTRIFHKQCRALAGAGYEVHLIVGGALSAELGGVRLHSIADSAERPPLRRQWGRLARAAPRALSLRASAYHLHDAHLIPLGLLLKLRGARVIYDVHEDYSEHARSKLLAHPIRARLKATMWRVLEAIARQTMDGFVCASPALARKFPPARTTIVRNFPLLEQFSLNGSSAAVPYEERPNTVLYIGAIRRIRGFWEMLRAVELLPAELDCRLRLIGSVREPGIDQAARGNGVRPRVELLPWQPFDTVRRELGRARVGLVLLWPVPNHYDAVRSNKLFEYMAAGVPVIAPDFPMWREIVLGTGCGLVVDPLDPAAIAHALEHLLTDPEAARQMGMRGRAAVEEGFNWGVDAPALLDLYRELANGAAPAPPGS